MTFFQLGGGVSGGGGMAPAGPPAAAVPGATVGLGDLFSLSGGAGLTAGYVSPKTVSTLE